MAGLYGPVPGFARIAGSIMSIPSVASTAGQVLRPDRPLPTGASKCYDKLCVSLGKDVPHLCSYGQRGEHRWGCTTPPLCHVQPVVLMSNLFPVRKCQ